MTTPTILVAGETLVDFLPESAGPLGEVESFSRRAGGAPANVAIALSQLETAPYFLSNLSTDPFGEFLAETLAENGVPTEFVTRDEERKTTLAFVSHDESAGSDFTFYRDHTADTVLPQERVGDNTLADCAWLYVGGVILAAEPARSAAFRLVERAREQDCSVVFDPNYRPELWESDEEFEQVIERMVGLVDVVKTSVEDLTVTAFHDESPMVVAKNLTRAGPHTAFLTIGEGGSRVVSTADAPWGETVTTHPGYPVNAVDTTGAGDAFVAGVLSQLARGETAPESVLEFANAVAALTTTEPGAITALPTREAVRVFQNRRR
ncbi:MULTISPECIES: carbohydrate kinase [unclassified Haladaptatus]|uniref:carbohydrate kinase family protein n=1 Tax=unclassified Haladaptatus TaxID=2622732 RepID=UPI0023E7E003|nr:MULTISPECIES: carbohydrate kinase [unclassified Haladaptatus]